MKQFEHYPAAHAVHLESQLHTEIHACPELAPELTDSAQTGIRVCPKFVDYACFLLQSDTHTDIL